MNKTQEELIEEMQNKPLRDRMTFHLALAMIAGIFVTNVIMTVWMLS
jgi:hypothetical protein